MVKPEIDRTVKSRSKRWYITDKLFLLIITGVAGKWQSDGIWSERNQLLEGY
jgi:hypothetical protein